MAKVRTLTGPARCGSCAEEAGIELPEDEELVLFSRWITPEVISRRFDAWFFLALAPAHTPPKPDGVETDRCRLVRAGAQRWRHRQPASWRSPSRPINQLESLLPFRTSDEAIEAHRDREVEPILPKVIGTADDHRVVLPGDPDYPT